MPERKEPAPRGKQQFEPVWANFRFFFSTFKVYAAWGRGTMFSTTDRKEQSAANSEQGKNVLQEWGESKNIPRQRRKLLCPADLPLKTEHRKFFKQKVNEKRRNFGESQRKKEQKRKNMVNTIDYLFFMRLIFGDLNKNYSITWYSSQWHSKLGTAKKPNWSKTSTLTKKW